MRVFDFLENFDFAFEDFNFGDFGFANGFNGVPIAGFAVHAFSNDPVVSMSEFFGFNMIIDADIAEGIGDHDIVIVHVSFVVVSFDVMFVLCKAVGRFCGFDGFYFSRIFGIRLNIGL